VIHILLCDDDVLFSETLHAQVLRAFDALDTPCEIRHCDNAGCLLRALEEGKADLVFLDLAIGEDDGYAVAEQIRRSHLRTEIVFVTNHPERMPEAFPFRPIGFLPKPTADEQIIGAVERFIHFYWREGAVFVAQNREQDVRIAHRDILYFESSGHRVLIHRAGNGEPVHLVRRLDEIERELEDTSFVRIHKSFLVHMDAVTTIDRTHMRAVLTCGRDLPISRSRYAQVMERFIHYRLR